jgi:hypothetical protein
MVVECIRNCDENITLPWFSAAIAGIVPCRSPPLAVCHVTDQRRSRRVRRRSPTCDHLGDTRDKFRRTDGLT